MSGSRELTHEGISRALEQALAQLRSCYRSTSTGGGWYHYLDDPEPGVTASAVGLYAFDLAGERFQDADVVIDYVLAAQVASNDDRDGGWAVRTTLDFPILEATAWVIRALSGPGSRRMTSSDALGRGVAWMERNQNVDHGWGSHRGQPSRVFHTSLSILALAEAGADQTTMRAGAQWLVGAQNKGAPAWGPLPGSAPSILHTAFALQALSCLDDAISAEQRVRHCDWLVEQLGSPQLTRAHTELSTEVEEYDVPFASDGHAYNFQNSLPHFAGPVAAIALLRTPEASSLPLTFRLTREFMASQRSDGTWELPRSKQRPSIWAVWPFVAALSRAREVFVPDVEATADLLSNGIVVRYTAEGRKRVTAGLILRNSLLRAVLRHKVRSALVAVAVVLLVTMGVLFALGWIDGRGLVLSFAIPALFLTFDLLWGRRGSS